MLTNTTNVNRYQIVGTPLSTYSISYPYWDKTEIVVYLTLSDGSLTTLTEGTNYTLSTPNGNNGTLTRVGDWTAGATNLTIVREMSFTQEVDLRNGDKIDAETLETALDDLTAQVQQLAESQSRAVISSIDEAGSSLTIPNKASRIGSGSGTMMGFGSDGESIALRDLAQFDADVASAASDASSASTSAGTATTQALKSEGYAVGEQNGSPVENTSPYYHNNSKYYSQVAKAGADVITNNLSAINNLDTNMSDINDVADDITNVVAVAGDLTNIDSVAGDLTNIDAVNSNKTNIDTVAGISSNVTTVAGISADVTTVAGATTDIATILPDIADVTAVAGDLAKVTAVADDLTNIDTVEADLTNVDTVAGDISNVNAVGGNITNVNAVAGNATNINAVNANKTNIDTVAGKASDITTVAGKANDVSTVAGIASNVTTVAGKATEITTVAGIASDVSAVAAVDDDIAAVADELTDIGTVVTNLSDISDVASDITKVTAVADDLTNIDAVADDLTNIDNAGANALKAEGWAVGEQNGVPVSSGSPYYQNNAKYYASEVPDLKNAINQHEARIENLEQKAGDYVEVQYRGTNAVPSGKAKNALVETIVGKSREWNQLVQNGNFASNSNWSGYNASFSVVDNVGKFTASASGGALVQSISLIKDHYYLRVITLKQTTSSSSIKAKVGGAFPITFDATTSWQTKADIFSFYPASGNYNFTVNDERSGDWDEIQVKNIIIRDLTLIFPEGVPATVAECVQKCPDILKYDAYGYSLVDTTVEGVESVGVNIWDEDWEVGGYRTDNGDYYNVNDCIRCKNYIPINPSTTYYLKGPSTYVLFYDADKNYIRYNGSSVSDGTFTTPENCAYIRFSCASTYGTTYNHDIQICLNSYTDKTTYHPYMKDTLSLSSPVTPRSAGSGDREVSDDIAVASGVLTTRVKRIDLGNLTWAYLSANAYFYVELSDMEVVASSNVYPRFTCSQYKVIPATASAGWANVDNMTIGTRQTTQYLCLKNTSKTDSDLVDGHASWLEGIILTYAITSPTTGTPIDPVVNNTIATEGGGTINTIQTQTPVIDNCLDVGYLAL